MYVNESNYEFVYRASTFYSIFRSIRRDFAIFIGRIIAHYSADKTEIMPTLYPILEVNLWL